MTPTSHTLVLGGDEWTLVEAHDPAEVDDAVAASGTERLGLLVRVGDRSALTQAARLGVPLVLDHLPTEAERDAIGVALRGGRVHASPSLADDLLVVAQHLAREAAPRLDLTQREREILELVSRGQSNRSVASTLYLSEFTVRNHLGRVFRKLGVTTRAEAAQALRDEQAASGAQQDGSSPAPNH